MELSISVTMHIGNEARAISCIIVFQPETVLSSVFKVKVKVIQSRVRQFQNFWELMSITFYGRKAF